MNLQNMPVILPLLLSGVTSGGLGLYAWCHRRGRDGVTAFAELLRPVIDKSAN